MEHRPIEVKLLCAKELKDVNVFSKMDVYVIGSISGDPRSMQRTLIDKDGGTNPTWNHEMQFTFDESAARLNRLGLVFQIMSNRTLGDKEIGRVYVPLKELFDVEIIENDKHRHVIYQVQTLSGKFKGQLEFSFKLGDKFIQSIQQRLDEPIIAYPVLASFRPMDLLGDPSISGISHHNINSIIVHQSYGYGHGHGSNGYMNPCMQSTYPIPNPHIGIGNGYHGYVGQTPPYYMQQRVGSDTNQKRVMSAL